MRDGARELEHRPQHARQQRPRPAEPPAARADTLDRVRSDVRAQRRKADDVARRRRALDLPSTTTAIRARAALRQARRALAGDAGAALDEPLRQLGHDAEYAGKIADRDARRRAARLASAIGELADSADAIAKRVRNLGGTVGSLAEGGDSLVDALDELDGGADQISSAVGAVGASVDGLASGVRAASSAAASSPAACTTPAARCAG